jgi:hypothetical protein
MTTILEWREYNIVPIVHCILFLSYANMTGEHTIFCFHFDFAFGGIYTLFPVYLDLDTHHNRHVR